MPANRNLKPSKIQGKGPNAKVQESFQCKDFNRFFMRAFKRIPTKIQSSENENGKAKPQKWFKMGKFKKKIHPNHKFQPKTKNPNAKTQ